MLANNIISLKKTFKNLEFLNDGFIKAESGVMLGTMVKKAISKKIKGLESVKKLIFHAGTKNNKGLKWPLKQH